MGGKVVNAQLGVDILVDEGEDIIHLGVVCGRICQQVIRCAFVVKDTVQENHEFGENRPFFQICAEARKSRQFVDKIAEAVLILFGQVELMGDFTSSVMKAGIEIRGGGGQAF